MNNLRSEGIDYLNQKPQIIIHKVFNESCKDVWQALTDKQALSNWLMQTEDFELIIGHKFQFKTTPRGKFDGIISCEVINFKENNELIYTWKAADMLEPTYVKWTIKIIESNETMLKLEHYGFEGFKGWLTKHMLNAGWKRILNKKLKNFLTK